MWSTGRFFHPISERVGRTSWGYQVRPEAGFSLLPCESRERKRRKRGTDAGRDGCPPKGLLGFCSFELEPRSCLLRPPGAHLEPSLLDFHPRPPLCCIPSASTAGERPVSPAQETSRARECRNGRRASRIRPTDAQAWISFPRRIQLALFRRASLRALLGPPSQGQQPSWSTGIRLCGRRKRETHTPVRSQTANVGGWIRRCL